MISGGVTGGVTGVVRSGSAAVRRAQTGFLRYYAARRDPGPVRRRPLLPDLIDLILTVTLSILIWLPLVLALHRHAAARRV